jgi:hypothetical protein
VRYIVLIFVVLLFSSFNLKRTIWIKGVVTVKGEKNTPVDKAVVWVEGTNIRTQTTAWGTYQLDVTSIAAKTTLYVVKVSHFGYQSSEGKIERRLRRTARLDLQVATMRVY